MAINSAKLHRYRLYAVYLLAAGMPNLNLLMSIGTILLLILWFVDPEIKKNIGRLTWKNPATWMAGLFVVHLLWLANTSDWAYAAKDLRVKLPLLALALSLGTIRISRSELKKVFLALGIGILVATVTGYYLYLTDPSVRVDPRGMAAYISHIRLGLMLIVFTGAAAYFFNELSPRWKVAAIAALVNSLVFLYLVQTLTAISVLLLAVSITLVWRALSRSTTKRKIVVIGASTLVLLLVFWKLNNYYTEYFEPADDALSVMEYTADGNPYNHYSTQQIENGNYVFANISEKEMSLAWNKRSDLKIGYDPEQNGPVIARLIRYLTSKGLPKDRLGVESLTEKDVGNIESGHPAEVYSTLSGLPLRLHSFLHGAHMYRANGIAEGSSFFQRLVYWKIGLGIARENLFLGTGTGDVKQVFKEAYEDYDVHIAARYRLRAHNQYITFLVTFGILGFSYFIVFVAHLFGKWNGNSLFLFFIVVATISFFTEDTLETQAGVTFFAFFTSLFSAAGAED